MREGLRRSIFHVRSDMSIVHSSFIKVLGLTQGTNVENIHKITHEIVIYEVKTQKKLHYFIKK